MPKRNHEKESAPTNHGGRWARNVGQDMWVVGFLPGRTLTKEQARAAVRVAKELDALRGYAALLGLTVLELVGLATMDRSGERLGSLGEAAQALERLGQAQ